jgi:hypothetical protein
LKDLEKSDIPSGYNEEADCGNHLKEIEFLRLEM